MALVEEYKKNLSEIERDILSDDNMYLYIPDFSRESDESQKQKQEEVEDSKFVLNIYKRSWKMMKKSKNHELPLKEQLLKRETKAIISLIYRSYLCSADESKKYKIDDEIELKKYQLELNRKYSYENLFQKKR